MIWNKLYVNTLVPQFPAIINANFASFERYINTFYDGSLGTLIVPIETKGKIKGARGEFVTAVVDNLIVKNQFTNLYDNNTTADYDFYKTSIEPAVEPRDPCTSISYWPWENPNYSYIDVNKPYYKIKNEDIIAFYNDNLSQVVGILLDTSISSNEQYKFALDPCSGSYFQIDSSLAGSYIEFMMTKYDASWGGTWELYKYKSSGEGGGGSGGSGIVGPGTVNYLSMFDSTTSVGDSPLYLDGSTLKTYTVDVDGSINLNGKEVQKYFPSLSSSLSMPNNVGGISAGTTVADLNGDSYEQLFNALLFPTVSAYIGDSNSLNLYNLSSATVEIGTTYTPNLTATYNPGLIKNGDDSNGPNLTGNANQYTFKFPDGSTDLTISASGNTQSHSFNPYVISAGSNIWSVVTNYDEGTGLYYDNNGNTLTNLDSQRIASSISANSAIITGRLYAWWDYGPVGSAPYSSSQIRNLSYDKFLSSTNTGTFDIVIPAGTQEVYFYIPTGKTFKVQYVESSFADLTEDFDVSAVQILDPNGDAHDYDRCVGVIGLSGYPSIATYRVTIT